MAAPKGKKVIRRRRERKHIEKGAALPSPLSPLLRPLQELRWSTA